MTQLCIYCFKTVAKWWFWLFLRARQSRPRAWSPDADHQGKAIRAFSLKIALFISRYKIQYNLFKIPSEPFQFSCEKPVIVKAYL